MNELDLPLGLDASDRDQAHNLAAVAILGLTAVAAFAGGIAWYVLRSDEPKGVPVGIQLAAPPLSIVPLDVPMLRPELREESAASPTAASRSITILDGKTGRRETLLVGADDDVPVTGSVAAPR